MKHIVFFGDSLTAGYGIAEPGRNAFPALIQNKIDRLGFNYQVRNEGLSGDTTESALLRLSRVATLPADIFVIALGANDMIRGYPPEHTAGNLRRIADTVKQKHPEVKLVLLGMELPSWVAHTRAPVYRNLFREIAQEYGMPYLPFLLEGVAAKPEYNLPDGLHPNAAGYVLIADRVWPVIHSLLEKEED